MATQPKTCADCGTQLGQRNRSGRCRGCVGRHVWTYPEQRERQRRGIKRSLAANPERLDAMRRQASALGRSPEFREKRRQVFLAGRFWEKGNAAQPAGSPSRLKAGARSSATRLAWCPPHLRDKYRALKAKGLKAGEARSLILEEHEIEMRRWRRSVGAEDDAPIPVLLPRAAKAETFLDRASVVAAACVGVEQLWTADRHPPVVRARWAVFLALQRGSWSVSRIAREVGMDRTTVRYGLAKAEVLAATADFAGLYRKVCAA